ncbi:MAG: hypothetical protein GDA41_12715 [Rhodospirillales bacterium]|nr:hypothetical protein [Rhodospirillales bacterium]
MQGPCSTSAAALPERHFSPGGSVGGSYDTALTESVTGLFEAGAIAFFGSWKSVAGFGADTVGLRAADSETPGALGAEL